MATKITTAIPGTPASANYLIRFQTSFNWTAPTRSPLKLQYVAGSSERPLGHEIKLATEVLSNKLVLDCSLQPNPFTIVSYKGKIPFVRPARAYVTVIAIFKRTEAETHSINMGLLRQNLTLYGVVESLVRNGVIPGGTDPRFNPNRNAWLTDMLLRTSLYAWKVSDAEIDRMQPAAGFSTSVPGSVIVRSKRQGEAGYSPALAACR